MLSSIAEWVGTVMAIGVVAGLVLLAAVAAGLFWLRRVVRRRVRAYGPKVVRFVREAAAGSGWDRMQSQQTWAAASPIEPR